MVKIKLNGREIEAEGTAIVLDIARREGLDIPTLCYHDALDPYGACRLCIVEAEGPSVRRSLMTSCNLAVCEGLSVETDSPLVKATRKMLFELLLGRSPDSRPLREMAERFGVGSTRFRTEQNDDCVRCGLCIRACREKIGLAAIAFADRGQKRHVTTEFAKPSETCVGCGACANVCPTGAIKVDDKNGQRTVLFGNSIISVHVLIRCEACGTPYTTRKILDYALTRLNGKETGIDGRKLCPECMRNYYAGEYVKTQLPYFKRT